MISDTDPAEVLLNFTVQDTVFAVSFGQLDSSLHDSIRMALAQGLAIGAGALLLFVSWFVIVNKKTPMFILHQVSLLLLIIRSGLYIGYLLGPFNSLSFTYTGLFYDYWDSFHMTIAVNTFYVLLIASIECILVYQIHVIFKSAKARSFGLVFLVVSAALAVVVVVLYIISITHNLMSVKARITDGYSEYASWENNLPFIMFAASINYTCVLLMAKLLIAVRTRRVLGLKQFDAMHILLIMSTQTCIIPSIMVIWSYTGSRSTVFLNLSVIIIVCNLPLSSLWASSANNSSTPSSCQNSFFSRTSTNDSADKTLSSIPISDFEKGTLAESISEAAGMHGDVDSIERILREVEQEQAYEH
ncbi:fungal pheromone mating factor STE2G-protein-coupled receptor [Metschnikowia bicuspidata var. bicuspidata NRRL YB-4993]|uniref:Fungal pheromone mating factor STE2G-protein-coupled receptor n=1 Tax=Metschnikowia bicuspidata var. bicuspidata NRRL YB-4993 TaxID=869754 RepID=A0A1A0H283_9ASCO|nr:fungal pheromone mating factor STE2G-protein-coupled receptor [Metschnikowia bicuspidata var. bicuspidata NRRL YB-4993]OBA18063.1 fungal pheromone mating factor STE2G-protein-coupled receptor [Metschnikowia bicuspidata var. bicuspidata NRRL YB-4993]